MEPVALGVVRMPGQQRAGEAWQKRRIHLAIAVQLDDHLGRGGVQHVLVAGHGRPADALILGMLDHSQAGVLAVRAQPSAALLGAGIVDGDDPANLRADARDDLQDLRAHAIAGNHNGDAGGDMHGGNVLQVTCGDGCTHGWLAWEVLDAVGRLHHWRPPVSWRRTAPLCCSPACSAGRSVLLRDIT
ncbi:hypothetical protein D3C71_941440 [compost metagenome]